MNRETYDLKKDVTAGELRERGWEIPESIPDVAHVPRWSIRYSGLDVKFVGDKLHYKMGAFISEPFRWIEGKLTIKKNSMICSECGSDGDDVVPDADAHDFYCNTCAHKLANHGEEDE